MRKRPLVNVVASARQRLLNQARQTGRPFAELLQHFAMERFLYRLHKSPHGAEFILKGALAFTAWRLAVPTRPTMDIDLLGRTDSSVEAIGAITRDICLQPVEPDGMVFDADSIEPERILADGEHKGVRVRRESFVAEKFHVMVHRGLLNSRMKDFFDLWLVARIFDFKGKTLATAIRKTFSRRKTEIPKHPVAWTEAFTTNPIKMSQWRGFRHKSRIEQAPHTLQALVEGVALFLSPIVNELRENRISELAWKAPGPWREPPSQA